MSTDRQKDKENVVHTFSGILLSLEPGILECEVECALGSTAMNKANEGDRIPAELFQILKMMLLKCYTRYASTFRKFSSGHKTGKGQLSIQSRRAMPKNVQTITQLNSSHTLAK